MSSLHWNGTAVCPAEVQPLNTSNIVFMHVSNTLKIVFRLLYSLICNRSECEHYWI